MSKMGTEFLRGRKRRRGVLVVLLLAIVMAVAVTVPSMAAWSEFSLSLNGNGTGTHQDAVAFSTESKVNLAADRVMVADNLYYARMVRITSDIQQNSSVQMALDTSGNSGNLRFDYPGGVTYSSNRYITASDLNTMLNRVSLYFDKEKANGRKSGTVELSITAYRGTSLFSYQLGTYTCDLTFYNFAEGEVVPNSTQVDYKAEYAGDDYDVTYAQAVPEGKDNDLAIEPADAKGGKASFNLRITDAGSGKEHYGYQAQAGYQIKKSSDPWAVAETFYDNKTIFTETDKDGKEINYNVLDKAGLPIPGLLDLLKWDISKPIPITVEGLDAGVTYDIRGILVTDGKTTSFKTTPTSIAVEYRRPNISSFNIGSTAKAYLGGTDTMTLAMLSTFNDENAVGKTYKGSDGFTYTGPAVSADVYFTPDYQPVLNKQEDGTEKPLTDNAKWYRVDQLSGKTMVMTDKNGTVSSTYRYEETYALPKKQSEVNSLLPDQPLDSQHCAFKIVLTDLYTGYSVYSYSDNFTVDSSAPTGLEVTAQVETKDKDGNPAYKPVDLALSSASVVGGGESKVDIMIGGAYDGGSQIKGYDYSMYYIASDDAVGMGSTRQDVLTKMANFTEKEHGQSAYTAWTAAEDAKDSEGNLMENMTKLSVSKDGYYRIDARAVDNAGRMSDPVTSAYFQVDLSQPSKPEAQLTMQNADGSFQAYDNRTYTNSTVWLFAYSKPKTGKTVETFEYSVDGGLTWTDFTSAQAGNCIKAFENTTQTVPYYGDGDYNNPKYFKYQIGVNLTGEGINDYNAILVQAKDSLTNRSIASDPVVMRTIAETPKPTSALQHEGIEVALAMGNTTMPSSTLTADLKNSAAKKINQKYYGETGSYTNFDADDFNPWLYIKNFKDPTESSYQESHVKVVGHNCNWEDDAACDGACHGVSKNSSGKYIPATCPYAILKENGFEVFTPAMVNVQGVAGADATDQSKFKWTRFDHTMFNIMSNGEGGNVQIPTVSYISDTQCITNLKSRISDQPTYKMANGIVRYTASEDRVVYMGQTAAANSDANGLPVENQNAFVSGSLLDKFTGFGGLMQWYTAPNAAPTAEDKGAPRQGGFPANGAVITAQKEKDGPFVTYTYKSIPAVDRYDKAGHWFKENNYDDWDAMGYKVKGWGEATIARRIYHLMDTSTAADPINGYANLNKDGDMSTIAGYNGYIIGSLRDWLFLYNSQSTRKEISYSITDTQINAHSADFDGFLFNSTIRQNKDGEWRLSGYMFMDGDAVAETVGTPRPPTNYKWWIIKINDVNLEQFADGCLSSGGGIAPSRVDDDIPLFMISHSTTGVTKSFPDGGSLDTIAYSEHDTIDVCTRHYKLVTEGDYTTLYVYNSRDNMSLKKESLNDIFKNSDLASTAMPSSTTTSGYKAINWKEYYGSDTFIGAKLYTPRPTVDGVQIGGEDARNKQMHTDTNCYGFGPIIGARSTGHGCYIDSRVVYTNIGLKMNVARKLSEVVNEPQWGGGKAKFITNISDDSIDDFQDPVLSSQIQWRLFTDKAKFIGWGAEGNKLVTDNFISRIEGDGTYEINNISSSDTDDAQNTKLSNQVDNIATYITQQYYKSFGFDGTTATGNIIGQVANKVKGKGTVYSLEDASNISFKVTPEKYNTSTANPDYPSGRWYIVHDTTGFTSVQESGVSRKYSDALDLKITAPGRYTVYFAPDAEMVNNRTLNPDSAECIFDFIINTPPVAQFSGEIKNTGTVSNPVYTVNIIDASYDPDSNTTSAQGVVKASNYNYTYIKDGMEKTASYSGDPVAGISKVEWRWEILDKQYDKATDTYTLKTIAASGVTGNGVDPANGSGWSTASPDKKTLSALTSNKVTAQGKALYGNVTSFSSLPTGAVLTVYQRVTDVSARKVYSTAGSFGGYKFVSAGETVSAINQQNLASGASVTYAPLSAMNLSAVNMYTTAADNSVIQIDRTSKQTQQKAFEVGWSIDIGNGYQQLVEYTPTHNYYLCSAEFYEAEKNRLEDADLKGVKAEPSSFIAGNTTELNKYGVSLSETPILVKQTDPSVDAKGQAKGSWYITKDTIRTQAAKGSMVLQIKETVQGLTQQDIKDMENGAPTIAPHGITNISARTIYYKQDDLAPSAQTVTPRTEIRQDNNTWNSTTYEASNYLDVTNADKRIMMNVSGAKDAQGIVSGYAYHFYEKSKLSGNTNGLTDALYETKIYYMNASHQLVEVPIKHPTTNAVIDVVNDELVAGSPWNSLSTDQKALAIKTARKTAVELGQRLPSSGGDIVINKNSMNIAAALNKPTCELNVAVFAYDNAKDYNSEKIDSLTGSNESQKTRVEGIKLSTSKPMPPAVLATNTLNQKAAHIGNDAGFEDITAQENPQVTELNAYVPKEWNLGYSATDVTVQFLPRKDKFVKNDTTNELEHNDSGTEYYEDIYRRADLTGVANVKYTVEYKTKRTDSYQPYKDQVNVTMPSARTLTFTEDGYYKVTAVIVNGAGTESDSREVEFAIAKTKPSTPKITMFVNAGEHNGEKYEANSWAPAVIMYVEDTKDNADFSNSLFDFDQYSYFASTSDGGKSWPRMGTANSTLTQQQQTFDTTGEYSVRAKVVSPSGVETLDGAATYTTIKIDSTAPDAIGPSLTASSTTTSIYSNYIVSLQYNHECGAVYSMQDGVMNEQDTEVAVPESGSVRFYFYPAEGYQLGEITYGGEPVDPGKVMPDTVIGADYLDIEQVNADASLTVQFVPKTINTMSYMAKSRASSLRGMTSYTLASAQENPEIENVEDSEPAGTEGDDTTPGTLPDETVYYTVKATYEPIYGGSVSPVEQRQVAEGDTVEYTITPESGYLLSNFQVNGVDRLASLIPQDDGSYTYQTDPIHEDTTVSATFAAVKKRSLHLTYTGPGTASVLMTDLVEDLGGGEYSVPVGKEISIYLAPNNNTQYAVKSFTINGVSQTLSDGTYSHPYLVPDEEDDIKVEVSFDVRDDVQAVNFTTEVLPSNNGEIHASVSPSGDETNPVKIPLAGAQTFIVTPDEHYRVTSVVCYQDQGDGLVPTELEHDVGNENAYTVKNPAGEGYIQVSVAMKTYSLDKRNQNIYVSGVENLNRIPEGSSATITLKPEPGYRIKDLIIKEGTDIRHLGAISTYVLQNIHTDIVVDAVFELRTVSRTETKHQITAVANNIKDAHDALAAEPYRFRISDGTNTSKWSDWSSSNTISYTGILPEGSALGAEEIPLDPNKRYEVSVQARDVVGNLSAVQSSTVYTLANMPATVGVEAIDTAGVGTTKSVALTVDNNGNPAYTEYRVYYYTSSAATDMKIANEKENGGWAQLQNGKFIVNGLTPGIEHHLQVVARNKDNYSTQLNDNDVASIRLSPAAPPEGSLYFEEQAEPLGPVVLRWDPPAGGDVEKIVIYRDGTYVAEVSVDELRYPDEFSSFYGNHIGMYSYAYVNSAGPGSTCTAVSAEYHEAQKNAGTSPEKLDAMDLMKANSSELLFSETMTYPRFPKDISDEDISADYETGSKDQFNGRIKLYVSHDTSVKRTQNYVLTLKAFKPIRDEATGEITGYEDVTDQPVLWDKTGQNLPKDAKATGRRAYAEWTGLNVNYRYQVFLQEISTTGPEGNGAGYGGQTPGEGIEGYLGKKCTVTKDGYSMTYTSETAKNANLMEYHGTWGDDPSVLLQYTGEGGWDRSLNNGYIAFNGSPSVALASDTYAGNDPEKLQTDESGNPYILVDKSMEDMTFKLNVLAWDQDGGPTDKASRYVKAEITGTGIIGKTEDLPADVQMPVSKEEAMAHPYTLEIDASGLATGVYTLADLTACDGVSEAVLTAQPIKLVVNRSEPSASVEGYTGVAMRIESGADYPKDYLKITTDVLEDNTDRDQNTAVRLLVMAGQYQEVFKSNDPVELKRWLCEGGNAEALAKAIELLGEDAGNSSYVSGGLLTEEGFYKAIEAVDPPVQTYVEIDKDTYDKVKAEPSAEGLVRREEGADGSSWFYWLEQDYALKNGLCTWLKTSESDAGQITVIGAPGSEEHLELVTSFGGNTSVMLISFKIEPEPSVKIRSYMHWSWVQTTIGEEYDYYLEFKVEDVLAQYASCYDENTPMDAYTPGQPAAELRKNAEGKDEMYIYKLVDDEAFVSNDWMGGYVDVVFGVHDQLEDVGVLLSPTQDYNPNDKNAERPAGTYTISIVNDKGESALKEEGGYRFSSGSNLQKGTTYYLWTYFKSEDTGELVYDKYYVARTTDKEFPTAMFGFDKKSYSYAEKDYSDVATVIFPIMRDGSALPTCDIKVSADYFQADEFGNILYEDGQPLKIEGERLEYAKQTLGFPDGKESVGATSTPDITRINVAMKLQDNVLEQGHMVVRLTLSVGDTSGGYGKPMPGGEYTDIFVQDNESPMQSFQIGVINNGVMDEIEKDGSMYYNYKFDGLQEGYAFQKDVLEFKYVNAGTGDLSNIQAKIYKDQAGKTELTDAFFRITQPDSKELPASMVGKTGKMSIQPMPNLKDGEYEAWIFLSADHMDPEDIVKIHVYQVVGQSTLRGRIYVRPEMPDTDLERTGSATISLYQFKDTTVDSNGSINGTLLYQTQSNENGGYYEIPNILCNKDQMYYVVVERDGFVTYNGVLGGMVLRPKDSKTYTFNLRLLGGDVDQNQQVNQKDMDAFLEYYNRAYDLAASPTTEEDKMLRRCDFNRDGGINALDRAYLQNNIGAYWRSYSYKAPQADP